MSLCARPFVVFALCSLLWAVVCTSNTSRSTPNEAVTDGLVNVTLIGPNGENLAIVSSSIVVQGYVYVGLVFSGSSNQPYPFVIKYDLNLNFIGNSNLTTYFPKANTLLLIGDESSNQIYAFDHGIVQLNGDNLKTVNSVSWGDRVAMVAWATPDYSLFFTALEELPLPRLLTIDPSTLEFTSNSSLSHLGNFALNYFQCLPSYTQTNVSYCNGLNAHITSLSQATYKISSTLQWLDESDVNGGAITSAPASYSGKEDLWTAYSTDETFVSGFNDDLRLQWNITLDGVVCEGIITNGKYLYVATSNLAFNPPTTTVYALNPSNGAIEQQFVYESGYTPLFSNVGQPLPFASSGSNNYLFVFSAPLDQSFPTVLTRIAQT